MDAPQPHLDLAKMESAFQQVSILARHIHASRQNYSTIQHALTEAISQLLPSLFWLLEETDDSMNNSQPETTTFPEVMQGLHTRTKLQITQNLQSLYILQNAYQLYTYKALTTEEVLDIHRILTGWQLAAITSKEAYNKYADDIQSVKRHIKRKWEEELGISLSAEDIANLK